MGLLLNLPAFQLISKAEVVFVANQIQTFLSDIAPTDALASFPTNFHEKYGGSLTCYFFMCKL